MKTFFGTVFIAGALLFAAGCRTPGPERVSLKPELAGPEILQFAKPSIRLTTPTPEGLSSGPISPANRFYRVGKTDSLVSIAERFYGDRKYAQDIYELNKPAVRQAGGLTRGLIIALPELGSGGAGETSYARP